MHSIWFRLLHSIKLRSSSCGAVLPELALIMPLMLLMLSGILELGRVISQVTWVAQTTYQTALLGAENPATGLNLEAMDTKAEDLRVSQQRWLMPNSFRVEREYVVPQGETNPDMVQVSISAELLPMMGSILGIPLEFHVEVFTPFLLASGGDTGSVDSFPTCDGPPDPDCI